MNNLRLTWPYHRMGYIKRWNKSHRWQQFVRVRKQWWCLNNLDTWHPWRKILVVGLRSSIYVFELRKLEMGLTNLELKPISMLVYCFLSIGLIFHLECLPVCWFIQRCVCQNTPFFVSESSLDLLVTHKPYPWLHNHIPLIHYSLFLYQNSLFMSTIQTCLFIFSVFPQSLWSLIYLTVTSGSYVWLSISSPMCI